MVYRGFKTSNGVVLNLQGIITEYIGQLRNNMVYRRFKTTDGIAL